MTKKLIASVLALLLILVMYVPAMATPPAVVYTRDDDDTVPAFACADGTIPIYDHYVAHFEVRLFFDKEGVPVRREFTYSGTDTLFTEVTGDLTFTGDFGWRSTWTGFNGFADNGDPLFLYEQFRGLEWNIQVPGYGAVIHTAGNVRNDYTDWPDSVLNTKLAGLRESDVEALCAAFGLDP